MASAELQRVRGLAVKLASIMGQYMADSRIAELRSWTSSHGLPPPEGTRLTPVEEDGLRGEWIAAPTADPRRRLLFFHGGGYVMGSPDTHRDLTGRLSETSGCAVLLLDYRLAPEHPFPAAVDDGLAALRWIREHGPNGPTVASSVFVGGDSAGGALALATLVAARDAGDPPPDAAVTLSAWTDLASTGTSFQTRAAVDPMTTPQQLDRMAGLYLNGADPRTPLASPLYAELRGLPPLLMQVGDAEVLLDDSTRVAEKVRAAGGEVTLEVWPEMIHVWQSFAGILPEGQQAIERIGQFLRAHARAEAR